MHSDSENATRDGDDRAVLSGKAKTEWLAAGLLPVAEPGTINPDMLRARLPTIWARVGVGYDDNIVWSDWATAESATRGDTAMSDDAKESARDIVATRFFERGHDQAYRVADRLITNLYSGGFDIVRRDHLAGNMEELNRQEITIDTLRIEVAALTAENARLAGSYDFLTRALQRACLEAWPDDLNAEGRIRDIIGEELALEMHEGE